MTIVHSKMSSIKIRVLSDFEPRRSQFVCDAIDNDSRIVIVSIHTSELRDKVTNDGHLIITQFNQRITDGSIFISTTDKSKVFALQSSLFTVNNIKTYNFTFILCLDFWLANAN